MKKNKVFKIILLGIVLVLLGIFIKSYFRVKDTNELTQKEYILKNQ